MPQVFLSPDNDPAMLAAMEKARATFRFFWRELSWERRRLIPGLELACVKLPFSDPPGTSTDQNGNGNSTHPSVEQMWVDQVEFDGQNVSGVLINSPKWLHTVHEGDSTCVPLGGISDWMYVVNGRVYGAFTVHLLRSRMDTRERTAHDSAWGLDFGDPLEPEIVPKKWFESKVKLTWMQKLLGSNPPLPPEWEEFEHPMAENMVDSLAKAIDEDPSFLTSTDDRGFSLLHQLALAGATSCVELLLKRGADSRARTESGMTAAQLADAAGWKRTAAVLNGSPSGF